ncbi:hypothetical protein [Alistipes indistinctus]|jgi:uncharacterized membrane protein|uniref:hypothetical protein n=1 Tax=Alistipes indistinctus TaxID=626932 RepID=UPI00242DF18E|nr:hypothetical protein [Alistipes indistinctus]
MIKSNLWQIITGMVVAAICGVALNMGVFSFFPALIVAIAWAGIKQTSGKEYKDKNGNYTEPEFWKDFVSMMAGALVMWAIVMIG